ncbi:hypothetical protein A4A49_64960, partial [Nicotiana attenuata]
CGEKVVLVILWSIDNPGRRLYGCRFYEKDRGTGCKFFVWFDPPTPEHLKGVILGLLKKKKALDAFMKASRNQKNWRRLIIFVLIVIVFKVIMFGT